MLWSKELMVGINHGLKFPWPFISLSGENVIVNFACNVLKILFENNLIVNNYI